VALNRDRISAELSGTADIALADEPAGRAGAAEITIERDTNVAATTPTSGSDELKEFAGQSGE
jgi:hypothetical protein